MKNGRTAPHPARLVLAALALAMPGCGEFAITDDLLLEAAGVTPAEPVLAEDVAALELLAHRYVIEVVDAAETEAILDEIRALAPSDALVFRAAVRAALEGQTFEEGATGDWVDLLIVDEATAQGESFIDLSEEDVEPALEAGASGALPDLTGLGQLEGALCDEGQAACALVPDWPLTMQVADCRTGCYGAFAADRVTDDPSGCEAGGCAVRLTFYPKVFTVIDGVTAAADCVLAHAQGALPARQGDRFEVRLSFAAIRKCGLSDELGADYVRMRVLAR